MKIIAGGQAAESAKGPPILNASPGPARLALNAFSPSFVPPNWQWPPLLLLPCSLHARVSTPSILSHISTHNACLLLSTTSFNLELPCSTSFSCFQHAHPSSRRDLRPRRRRRQPRGWRGVRWRTLIHGLGRLRQICSLRRWK